jgi:hypothetical protein
VQGLSPLDAAIRFLPAPISGALTNVVVGLVVHRVRADWIVISTSIPCVLASVLMAVAKPSWSYWKAAFLANLLNPIAADGIFTVSNLLITSMFPSKTRSGRRSLQYCLTDGKECRTCSDGSCRQSSHQELRIPGEVQSRGLASRISCRLLVLRRPDPGQSGHQCLGIT